MPTPDARRDPMPHYTTTAVVLHWLIAALVVGQFAWGWLMQEIPKSPPGLRADAFNLHKSIGLCVLTLMLVRLGWRLAHRPPPLPSMPAWQARLAKATHVALYAALIVMPVAGYLGSAWSGYPVRWFGITLPAWAGSEPVLKEAMRATHYAASWVLLALFVLHVAGAAYHARRSDGVMARMKLARRGLRRRAAGARIPAVD